MDRRTSIKWMLTASAAMPITSVLARDTESRKNATLATTAKGYGTDPKKSVTNQWCQTWDVKNLFITDGGPFASNADKNPTLTIMALAWRTAEHALEEMRKGNV